MLNDFCCTNEPDEIICNNNLNTISDYATDCANFPNKLDDEIKQLINRNGP